MMQSSDVDQTLVHRVLESTHIGDIDTVVLDSTTRNAALTVASEQYPTPTKITPVRGGRIVTADDGTASFVRSHRAPTSITAYVVIVGIGVIMLAAALVLLGVIVGASLTK